MSLWKTIENDVEIVWTDVENFAEYLVGEEINTWKTEILPLFQSAAVTLQNEAPGLDAKDFIAALVAAVIPILPIALKDLEVTLLTAIAASVAKFFGVTNAPGNQGIVS